MAQADRTLVCRWLGRVAYDEASRLQVEIREALRRGEGEEHLLLLEHPHVYTLGRNATRADVLWSDARLAGAGVEVHESDRGGQVTYHGPGQLVGYPIVDLDPDRRDLRRYVRDLSATLVDTLAGYGVESRPGEGERIGVWCDDRKIASIGIHLSRWITTHGFALNVATDLGFFGGIVACGLTDVRTTTLARERGGEAPPLEEVAARFAERFARRFERVPRFVDLPRLAESPR
ncbi:MAG: lipoyl(octanoyl) transferase LipB [Holophagales bacterium]|nr:lipoyl(octanoyl) transferase LipB [Holophagales bacterium]